MLSSAMFSNRNGGEGVYFCPSKVNRCTVRSRRPPYCLWTLFESADGKGVGAEKESGLISVSNSRIEVRMSTFSHGGGTIFARR
jgi:ribosomal protein L24E